MSVDSNDPGTDDAPSGRLTENIVYFARALRRTGLPIGPAQVLKGIEAVETTSVTSRHDFYWALHAAFVSKRDQHLLFDETFKVFWRTRGLLDKMLELLSPAATPPKGEPEKPRAGASRVADAMSVKQDREIEDSRPRIEIDAKLTVSGREILRTKDFARMSADEVAQAKLAISELSLPLDKVPTRRLVANERGRRIDGRRTLRSSLRSGGDMIDLRRRDRALHHPPIVAIIDISGSMNQYSRLFLHFMHGLMAARPRVHVFLFGTRLTNVTRQLATRDPDEALEACSGAVEDWSGGTRIATALHKFNRDWSRRVLSGGPIVLLITDGLERDSDENLPKEVERLQKSCRRLVWLNPLLRYEGFEPRAAGVRAILPWVHEFRSVHSLETITELCAALSTGGSTQAETDPRHWLERVTVTCYPRYTTLLR